MATAVRSQARPLFWGRSVVRRRGDIAARRRYFIALAVVSLVLICVALLNVWVRLQVVQTGYVLATTSKLYSRLEQEHRELRVEIATLTSPDRLEQMARKRLGLIPPEKGQVVVLP